MEIGHFSSLTVCTRLSVRLPSVILSVQISKNSVQARASLDRFSVLLCGKEHSGWSDWNPVACCRNIEIVGGLDGNAAAAETWLRSSGDSHGPAKYTHSGAEEVSTAIFWIRI